MIPVKQNWHVTNHALITVGPWFESSRPACETAGRETGMWHRGHHVRKALVLLLIIAAASLVILIPLRWMSAWDFWRGCVYPRDMSRAECIDVGTSLLGRLGFASALASLAGVAAWGAFWFAADPRVESPRQGLARQIGLWTPVWMPMLGAIAFGLGLFFTSVELAGEARPGGLGAFIVYAVFAVPIDLFIGLPVALIAWGVRPPTASSTGPPSLHSRPRPGGAITANNEK